MSLVGFKAQNHQQQLIVRGPRPHIDDRGTTPEVFDPLHERFAFTVDVAAAPHNAKLPRFYTIEDDGLAQSWAGERVWCNPPYSSIEPWVAKAHESDAELVVMLLPANRTEQGWWQRQVEPYRRSGAIAVEFLPGRLRFLEAGAGAHRTERAPALRMLPADLEPATAFTGWRVVSATPERAELASLHAKVWQRDADGHYYHWTRDEHDRVRALMRKADPGIRFAPSSEEMARRFGHRSRRESS